ncbi:MAG: hypothetical protein AVDCRST_MAG17-1149, partial [uncultured Solirubrobacterales bacterium]
ALEGGADARIVPRVRNGVSGDREVHVPGV